MQRQWAKFWFLLVPILLVGLPLFWAQSRRSPRNSNAWLLLSRPAFGTRTNAQGVCRTVAFSASNVGPRTLDFKLGWFECRAGVVPVFATSHLVGANIPLARGATTNLMWDLARGPSSDGDLLCCCEIRWLAHKSMKRRFGEALEDWTDVLGVRWPCPWRNERRVGGEVFSSNVEVADYFRIVHGLTRRKWLERNVPPPPAGTYRYINPYRVRLPTADEQLESEAKCAFVDFVSQ